MALTLLEAIPKHYDFSDQTELSAEKKAKKLVKLNLNKEIDLSKPPLAKFLLIKISDEKHHFALITHHTMSDGESARIILDYISNHYNGNLKKSNEMPLGESYYLLEGCFDCRTDTSCAPPPKILSR